jgi:hypothetical protein
VRHPGGWIGLLEATAIVSAILAVLVGGVVGVGGPAASACTAYPGCLFTPSGVVAGIHVVGAGLLLLLALVSLVLALALRATAPRLALWAAAALGVLIGMASLGSLFAAGVLSTSLAPVQYGFLTALVALDLILAGATHAAGRSNARAGPVGR